jgi:hypothetical protein
MISISKSTDMDASKHLRFNAFPPQGINHFASIITHHIWSPILWSDGVRKRNNFLSCHYIALDFDDGQWTLEDAKTWVTNKNLKAILGTSKSHQIEKVSGSGKVSPPVDRFRLVVPFAQKVTDRDEYEYNMRELMEFIPCDISCKDAARFFYPCKEIYYIRDQGNGFDPVAIPEEVLRDQAEHLQQIKAQYKEYRRTGLIPMWAISKLKHGAPEGERHTTCYRLGATLHQCGWDTEKILKAIAVSPLRDIGLEEAHRAATNGITRAVSEMMEDQHAY